MPETLEEFLMTRPPTAERPLLGQTILVVEDSRFACEALRLICQRSGARIRRADSLKSASRHLRTYRPGIVLIDVGLPDGSGLDLISDLALAEPRINVIAAMSGDDTLESAAMKAGACTFLSKPLSSISAFQEAMLAQLPQDARPTDLRPATYDEVVPDRIAYRDDLSLAADLLSDRPDQSTLAYVSAFLIGIAKSVADPDLESIARDAGATTLSNAPFHDMLGRLLNAVETRLHTEQAV